jgi:predicted nucleic acid binding AN1-type Zn finger protein
MYRAIDPDSYDKPKIARCSVCKKKVLIPIYCRCTLAFCMTHRHPENHACQVNFKQVGKERLILENPKIECMKIDSI